MMETKELMSGIAVVIDDALDNGSVSTADSDTASDLIGQIVEWFEREWALPFVKKTSLPNKALWPNLLQAASFVLLDWRFWPRGARELERRTIQEVVEFLKCARKNLVPVFIFTNENPDDVRAELPPKAYDAEDGRSFVFVIRKNELWSDDRVDVTVLDKWVHGNASVYALKTWERVLNGARTELFRSMCARSVDWPRVFWQTYVADDATPSASLTNLINDSLRGRMRLDAFEKEHLGESFDGVAGLELRELIAETSFRRGKFLPNEEIRCGDLYKASGGKFWLNMRADCDCIPRDGRVAGEIEVHCVEGKKLGPSGLNKAFHPETGSFEERVFESIAFAIVDGASVSFNFRKFRVMKFSEVRDNRVGRLLHPYLTRVQQRYALYTQRQALPRVPKEALPEVPEL